MQKDPLGQLQKHIDESSLKASQVARRFADIVRGDILRLLLELDIAHSAKARKEVEDAIRADIAELEKRLAEIEESAMQFAVQSADNEYIEYKKKEDEELKKVFGGGGSGKKNGKKVQSVKNKKDKKNNGLVRYSEKRAREIIALASGNGESLAAVYTKNMEHRVIKELRQATLMGILESSIQPMTHREQMKATRKNWEKAVEKVGGKAEFVDSAGKTWDSSRYFQMNIRTNAMRIYNDRMAMNLTENGFDLVQVSRGGEPKCHLCFPWEGRVLSLTGKTKGFPTYQTAVSSGLFHPNCVHTIQYIDPLLGKKEIELQQGVMPENMTPEALIANREKIDIARKQAQGMSFKDAVIAVDRDNLEDSIRAGLLTDRAKDIVKGLTDSQVSTLCASGQPPRFDIAGKGEKEGWNKGSSGGVVRIGVRNNTAEGIISATGLETPPEGAVEKREKEVRQLIR